MDDVVVVVGGIIPDQDIANLKNIGSSRDFPAGYCDGRDCSIHPCSTSKPQTRGCKPKTVFESVGVLILYFRTDKRSGGVRSGIVGRLRLSNRTALLILLYDELVVLGR